MDVWLNCNRRALLLGCVPPLGIFLLGVALVAWPAESGGLATTLSRLAGVLLILSGLVLTSALLWSLRRPRIAYVDGQLLLDLVGGPPIRLPVSVVECFFLGQGPSHLGRGKLADSQTANVVIRLAERATDWHQRDVRPALGRWCDGYITIRGAWSEPIDAGKVEELNQRLVRAHREVRAASHADGEGGAA